MNSNAYQGMYPFAVIMIAVWPIGVPLTIATLLWRDRAKLLEARRREKVLAPGLGLGLGLGFA